MVGTGSNIVIKMFVFESDLNGVEPWRRVLQLWGWSS